MKKEYKLRRNSSFQYIFKNGKRLFSGYLILYKVKAKNIKLGVSVSKKIGNSVVRSKVKRWIKEAFNEEAINIEGNYNFVIVARVGIKELGYWGIKEALIDALKKENIYKKKKDINEDCL